MTNYTNVDADSLIYKCAYGDNVTNAMLMSRWNAKIEHIKVNTYADHVLVAVKGRGNFRESLDTEYKAQRKPQEPEMKRKLNWLAQYALDNGAVQCDGWEADDQVVSWAYDQDKDGDQYVIAAIDKDILQYPGNHYNYGGSAKKPIPEADRWVFTSPEEGWYRFCSQLITGDAVDNIKGIYRAGPARAKKELTGLDKKGQMNAVISMYKEEYKTDWERKLDVNCNLIYMRLFIDDVFVFVDHV